MSKNISITYLWIIYVEEYLTYLWIYMSKNIWLSYLYDIEIILFVTCFLMLLIYIYNIIVSSLKMPLTFWVGELSL